MHTKSVLLWRLLYCYRTIFDQIMRTAGPALPIYHGLDIHTVHVADHDFRASYFVSS